MFPRLILADTEYVIVGYWQILGSKIVRSGQHTTYFVVTELLRCVETAFLRVEVQWAVCVRVLEGT